MVTALVLINCHFPFDKQIIEKLEGLSGISDVYRTLGIYDLIAKITSSSEKEFKATMSDITRIHKVNSTVTMIIAEKQQVIVETNPKKELNLLVATPKSQ